MLSRSRSLAWWSRAAIFVALVAALAALGACGVSSPAPASTLEQPLISTDVLGTTIKIPEKAPQRIISLTAGDSEMLAAAGVSARVVAVDAFTNYPAAMASKPKVTGADGKVNIEQIIGLKPDLVLGWGGFFADAEKSLLQAGIPVVDLPQRDLEGTFTEIRLVGQLVHAEKTADDVVAGLRKRVDAVKAKVAGQPAPSVYMEIGYTPAPPYAFGKGSFGDEIIRLAGGTNIFGDRGENSGYPSVSVESILAANPQVVILTEDPQYGGDPNQVGARPGWNKVAAVQDRRVYNINPDMIERPGPRLVDALEQVAKLLHPDSFR